jgi:hypothetical protein
MVQLAPVRYLTRLKLMWIIRFRVSVVSPLRASSQANRHNGGRCAAKSRLWAVGMLEPIVVIHKNALIFRKQ